MCPKYHFFQSVNKNRNFTNTKFTTNLSPQNFFKKSFSFSKSWNSCPIKRKGLTEPPMNLCKNLTLSFLHQQASWRIFPSSNRMNKDVSVFIEEHKNLVLLLLFFFAGLINRPAWWQWNHVHKSFRATQERPN